MNPDLAFSLVEGSRIIGWTLVHFLWQGLAIGAIYWVLMNLLRDASSNARYLAALGSLLLCLAAPVATFLWLMDTAPAASAATAIALASDTNAMMAAHPSLWMLLLAATEAALPWMVLAWSIGVMILSVRAGLSWWVVQRLRRQGVSELPRELQVRLAELMERFDIQRPVRAYQSLLVRVPTVIGWLRPVILLPVSTVTGLSPRQLEWVLAHELGHIRRYDYLVNLLQIAIETLLFYHPVVNRISSRIRQERENCCDDLVLSDGADRLSYARTLTSLETFRHDLPRTAMAATGGQLFERIRRIVKPHDLHAGAPNRTSSLLALALGLVAMMSVQTNLVASMQHPVDLPSYTAPGAEIQPWKGHGAAALGWLRYQRQAERERLDNERERLTTATLDALKSQMFQPAARDASRGPAIEAAFPQLEWRPVTTLASLGEPAPPAEPVPMSELDKISVRPRVAPLPDYPLLASAKDIEGEVNLAFRINAEGRVTDVRVIEAAPEGVFEKAAINALKDWRYDPQPREVTQLVLSQQFEFRLPKDRRERRCIRTGSRLCSNRSSAMEVIRVH